MVKRLTQQEQDAMLLAHGVRQGSGLNFADDYTFREDLELERELEERRRANDQQNEMELQWR